MKSYECASWVLTLFILLRLNSCSTSKRRLCIEFKKENHLAKCRCIAKLHAETENKCLVNCVRRHPCMAFNYHVVNKTCILMPQLKCMAPSSLNNSGYLFVHLQSCKLQPVWFSVRPPDRDWKWIITTDPRKDTNIVKLTGPYARCVSRTLHRGYYLPGWWLGPKFRTVDPVTMKDKKCRYGEFLAFPDPSSYRWISYTAGDSLPDCALPLSELPDGTALYIVRYGSDTISGFYNPLTKSTYFAYWGVIKHKKVHILCSTDVWSVLSNGYPVHHRWLLLCWLCRVHTYSHIIRSLYIIY